MAIKLREDLVLVEQVEDKSNKIVLVGGPDDGKKYFDIMVVQVGDAVTRTKAGDKVFISAMPQGIRIDLDGSGIKKQYGVISEAAVQAVEV